jgi:hypothetical protein
LTSASKRARITTPSTQVKLFNLLFSINILFYLISDFQQTSSITQIQSIMPQEVVTDIGTSMQISTIMPSSAPNFDETHLKQVISASSPIYE